MRPYARVEFVTLPAAKIPPRPNKAQITAIKAVEAQAILKTLKSAEYLVALSEEGREFTSLKLAAHLQKLALQGQSRLAFVLGGTLGLGEEVIKRAGTVLSLSRFTFTHELARLILLEQLYRAFKINAGEPYHY